MIFSLGHRGFGAIPARNRGKPIFVYVGMSACARSFSHVFFAFACRRSGPSPKVVTGTSNPQVPKRIIFLVLGLELGAVLGGVLGGVLLQPQGPGALFEHSIQHFL